MYKRKRVSRKSSKRNFSKGQKTKKINHSVTNRGGIRL